MASASIYIQKKAEGKQGGRTSTAGRMTEIAAQRTAVVEAMES